MRTKRRCVIFTSLCLAMNVGNPCIQLVYFSLHSLLPILCNILFVSLLKCNNVNNDNENNNIETTKKKKKKKEVTIIVITM